MSLDLHKLSKIHLTPYISYAMLLRKKPRVAGGTMFRHQIDTLGILLEYEYIDSVLLKAAVIHDLIEDIEDFDSKEILTIDEESKAVYDLVMEVTREKGQSKNEYLKGLITNGSENALILKCADRISNMISLGFVTDPNFIDRYCEETEVFVVPMSLKIKNCAIHDELMKLIISRRQFFKEESDYNKIKKMAEEKFGTTDLKEILENIKK